MTDLLASELGSDYGSSMSGKEIPDKPSVAALGLEAFQRLFADEALPLAGNIAFRAVFSVFPFLIFLTALAGFVGDAHLAEQVVNFLISVGPNEVLMPLASEVRSILTVPRSGLLSVSALLTVWSAMGGVDSVRVGLNRAYDIRESRHVLALYAQGVLVVVGAACLLLALAVLIVFAPILIAFVNARAPAFRGLAETFNTLRYPAAFCLLTGGLLFAHRILPARRLSLIEALPGVILTVMVWIALSAIYSFYLVEFATFASTYAGLSGLFAAMFFTYLAAIVLILGGEFNRVLAVARLTRDRPKPGGEQK